MEISKLTAAIGSSATGRSPIGVAEPHAHAPASAVPHPTGQKRYHGESDDDLREAVGHEMNLPIMPMPEQTNAEILIFPVGLHLKQARRSPVGHTMAFTTWRPRPGYHLQS